MGWTCSPSGELIGVLEGDQFIIQHAEPHLHIHDTLVAQWRAGTVAPWVTLTGDVLRIRAANRTVVYRLIEHIPDRGIWIAEWPD